MIPWLLRHTVVPLWAVHERSPYLRVADRLERERNLSLDERMHRQWEQLQDMMTHAWTESPFYQRRFAASGFEPGDLRALEDLRRLPILTKQEIRENRDEILARSYRNRTLVRKTTSGSTGVSLEVLADDVCMQRRRGVLLYRDRWSGWNLGEYRAYVWGNPPPFQTLRQRLRRALLDRFFFLDTLALDDASMHAFSQQVLEYQPTLLFGHAHSIYLLARFWEDNALPRYRFKGAISTAMMLHQHERDSVERVFATRVFDRYGCEEVSLIASECEAHTGLHVNTDSLLVELVDEDGHDGAGRVIVTDLDNRAMPILRYDVGDRAIPASKTCACGRTYPLLERITGRVADYLVTPSGKRISGISLTENFAVLIPGVEQVQLIQERLTHLRVRIVAAPSFGAVSRGRVADLVRERFGPEMDHAIELVERIEPEPSGKHRFSICRVPEGEWQRLNAGNRRD